MTGLKHKLMDVLFGKEDAPKYVSRTNHSKVFTGNCMVRQHTGDGVYVGRCYHSTYNGYCPLHGSVAVYLDDLAEWPEDYNL